MKVFTIMMHDVREVRSAVPYGVVPHFQPILSISGQLSYEALGRLEVGGDLLPPSHFLPILEGTHRMAEFDRAVAAKAIRQVARWNACRFQPIHLHVNASSEALSDRSYAHFLREMLAVYELQPELLTVEIVETCSFWKEPQILDTLSALRWLGVNLAIDDFPCWEDPRGLLAYLRQETIHFGTLKLDRSLVTAICDKDCSPRKFREVVKYVQMARQHDMTVVAEGVEDQLQAITMQLIGADELQGFGIGRPQPAHRVHHLLYGEEGIQLPVVSTKPGRLVAANT